MSARLVRLGRTSDIECHRTTHRLRLAKSILAAAGVEAVWPEHDPECDAHPRNRAQIIGTVYGCSRASCAYRQAEILGPTWPEWVTAETFAHAWALAAEIQTARGEHHRAGAGRLHATQEAV